jgi:hypothetical protein
MKLRLPRGLMNLLPLVLALIPISARSDSNISPAIGNSHAYGANIGWIQFENLGNPRVNLASGRLLGYAYSANVGWIALSESGVAVVATSIDPGVDSDNDGIPDNWERQFTGEDLSVLTETGDRDGDGESDAEEYAADTHPLNPNDRLRITAFIPPRDLGGGRIATDLAWTSKPSRRYSIVTSADPGVPFLPVLEDIVPAAGATTSARINDSAQVRHFYRVSAKFPLAP